MVQAIGVHTKELCSQFNQSKGSMVVVSRHCVFYSD